jgi:hypothetical protein
MMSDTEEIRKYIYHMLNQYSVDDIKAQLQYCLDNPEPSVVEVACFTRSIKDRNEWAFTSFDRAAKVETIKTVVPHTQMRSLIDDLLNQGYVPYLDSNLDPDIDACLYLCKTVARRSYETA